MQKPNETQILAEVVKQVLKEHVIAPLAKESLDTLDTITQEWSKYKGLIEAVCLNRISQCPLCGGAAIAGGMCENELFVCPECGETLMWHKKEKGYTLTAK